MISLAASQVHLSSFCRSHEPNNCNSKYRLRVLQDFTLQALKRSNAKLYLTRCALPRNLAWWIALSCTSLERSLCCFLLDDFQDTTMPPRCKYWHSAVLFHDEKKSMNLIFSVRQRQSLTLFILYREHLQYKLWKLLMYQHHFVTVALVTLINEQPLQWEWHCGA